MITERDQELGRHLINEKMITFDEMKGCLDRLNASKGKTMAQIVVEEGLVAAPQIREIEIKLFDQTSLGEEREDSEEIPGKEIESMATRVGPPPGEIQREKAQTTGEGETFAPSEREKGDSCEAPTQAGLGQTAAETSPPPNGKEDIKTNPGLGETSPERHLPKNQGSSPRESQGEEEGRETAGTTSASQDTSDHLSTGAHGEREMTEEELENYATRVPQEETHSGTSPRYSKSTIGEGDEFGDLRIVEKLGEGGMGKVFLAEQISLGRQVAVKVISRELCQQEEFATRFVREAQLAAQISHPNIIQVYQIGDREGQKYIVLEYIEGCTLLDIVRQKGPMPLKELVEIMIQAAKGLCEAHRKGIVHRDIKPDNIFIDRSFNIKLGDFGLAKSVEKKGLTQTGAVLGTPYYMSPEQVEGRDLDGKTDIYALGATWFHCLIGNPPFQGDSAMQVLYHHVYTPLELPSEFITSLPRKVQQLLQEMMDKKSEKRPDPESLLERLKEIWRSLALSETALEIPPPSSRPPRKVDSEIDTAPAGDGQTQIDPRDQQLGKKGGERDSIEEDGGQSPAQPSSVSRDEEGESEVEEMATFIRSPSADKETKKLSTEERIMREFKKNMAQGNYVGGEEKQESSFVGQSEYSEVEHLQREDHFQDDSLVIDWFYFMVEFARFFNHYRNAPMFEVSAEEDHFEVGQTIEITLQSNQKRPWQAWWLQEGKVTLLEDSLGKIPPVEGQMRLRLPASEVKSDLHIFFLSTEPKLDFPVREITRSKLDPGQPPRERQKVLELIEFLQKKASEQLLLTDMIEFEVG